MASVRLEVGMERALQEARRAAAQGEIPVGAALFLDGMCRFWGHNQTAHSERPLHHAEWLVLEKATAVLSQEQMRQATLFVTLEPCPMCMGAILQSHLGCLVYAADNLKWGACGTVADLTQLFPAQSLQIVAGVCEQEAQALLQSFFQRLRLASLKSGRGTGFSGHTG